MTRVEPFRATIYDNKKIENLADVLVPPYDVIPHGEEKTYWDRSPYNLAHVLLSHGEGDDYSHAAELLTKWRQTGILKEDSTDHYFLYEQSFDHLGQRVSRRTLFAAVLMHDFKDAIIRPHENTHGKYKKDRLQILRKTHHNLSHIFGMVRDREGFLAERFEKIAFHPPMWKGKTSDGVEQAIWRIDPTLNRELQSFFSDKPVYIVDGHHRYSSAWMYAEELGVAGDPKHPAARMMFAIANAYDPALVVYPTHRILKSAAVDWTTISSVGRAEETNWEDMKKFTEQPSASPTFGVHFKGRLFLCTPDLARAPQAQVEALKGLAVWWTDDVILKSIPADRRSQEIDYDRSFESTRTKLNTETIAFFHSPPLVDTVLDISDQKGFMPQKSTYFYPKLLAGLTLRKIS